MSQTIDIADLIKSCETETALEFLEQCFTFTVEQKRVALQQRIIFWTNALAEDVRRETATPGNVVPDLMVNWTDEERRQFNEDWANDDFVITAGEAEQPYEAEIPVPLASQIGEGSKRKHTSDDSETYTKRQRPEEYFTIKSAKQVNVRKFKTTGTDYTVQFMPLNVHGVSNVMSSLNSAFKHLFDRLTIDMAPNDQVRLILNSHQLDRPISLPFLPRDCLTPKRFLAGVKRVVQLNHQFTLDESVNVNMVHVEMPHGVV